MRKIILSLFMVLVAISACKEHEIELYNQAPRIKFKGVLAEILFDDKDYAHKVTERDLPVQIEIMGLPLSEPRTFVLKAEKREGLRELKVKLPEKYVFEAGQYGVGKFIREVYEYIEYSGAIVKVQRPEKYTYKKEDQKITYQAILTFDTKENNPLHQFDPGLIERSKFAVSAAYRISQPISWNVTRWGAYSVQKYTFMMDVLEEFYDEFNTDEKYKEAHKKVYDAYEKYKTENDEIKDDDGDPITFPQNIP